MSFAHEPEVAGARTSRPGPAPRRVIVRGVSGCAAAGAARASGASFSVAALCAFDVAALVFLVWVWLSVRGADFGTVIVAITVSSVASLLGSRW